MKKLNLNAHVSENIDMTNEEALGFIKSLDEILIKLPSYFKDFVNFYNLKLNGVLAEGETEETISIKMNAVKEIWSKAEQADSGFITNDLLFAFNVDERFHYRCTKRPPINFEFFSKEMVEAMSYDEIINALCPPDLKPNDVEIKLAMYLNFFEEFVWDFFIDILNLSRKEEISLEMFEKIKDKYSDIEKTVTEDLKKEGRWKKWFDNAYVASLSEMHNGDCTAMPCSCMRCHADELFNAKVEKFWSKSLGADMFSRLMKFNKER